jgi:hypothetical protein
MRVQSLLPIALLSASTFLGSWMVLSSPVRDNTALLQELTLLEKTRAEVEQRVADVAKLPTDDPDEGRLMFRRAKSVSELDAELQLEMLSHLEYLGISPNAFRQLDMPPLQGVERRAIQLEFDTSYEAALGFMAWLETAKPPFGTSQLRLLQKPLYPGEDLVTPVSVRLVAWTFWQNDAGQKE